MGTHQPDRRIPLAGACQQQLQTAPAAAFAFEERFGPARRPPAPSPTPRTGAVIRSSGGGRVASLTAPRPPAASLEPRRHGVPP